MKNVIYKVAICDDVSAELDALEKMLSEYQFVHSIDMKIDKYRSGEELFREYKEGKYDFLFLDVQMDGISGIDLAKKIRISGDNDVIIIYLSNHTEYMARAFDVRPFHYLEKQYLNPEKRAGFEKKFESVLMEAFKEFDEDKSSIFIKSPSGKKVVYRIKDIAMIKAVEREDGKLKISYRNEELDGEGRLKSLMKDLSEFNFIFVNRWCIVNLTHIVDFDNHVITIDNGEEIHIGRSYLPDVQHRFSSNILSFS